MRPSLSFKSCTLKKRLRKLFVTCGYFLFGIHNNIPLKYKSSTIISVHYIEEYRAVKNNISSIKFLVNYRCNKYHYFLAEYHITYSIFSICLYTICLINVIFLINTFSLRRKGWRAKEIPFYGIVAASGLTIDLTNCHFR